MLITITLVAHIYGVVSALFDPAFTVAFTALMRNYTLHDSIAAIVKHRPRLVRVVPPTELALAKDLWVATQDLSSIKQITCAGAVLAPDIITMLNKLMPGVKICQRWE